MSRSLSTRSLSRREQYARWARLLDALLPAPDDARLVTVGTVARPMVATVQECLCDAGLSPVLSEITSALGDSRFRVMVAARDAGVAGEVMAGF